MIKSIKEKEKLPIEIDLTGPQGNAFCLLGMAKNFYGQLDKTKEETEDLMKRMQSSDYDNLVKIFDEEFGDFVTLYR